MGGMVANLNLSALNIYVTPEWRNGTLLRLTVFKEWYRDDADSVSQKLKRSCFDFQIYVSNFSIFNKYSMISGSKTVSTGVSIIIIIIIPRRSSVPIPVDQPFLNLNINTRLNVFIYSF